MFNFIRVNYIRASGLKIRANYKNLIYRLHEEYTYIRATYRPIICTYEEAGINLHILYLLTV
jgi:hypothetical protein